MNKLAEKIIERETLNLLEIGSNKINYDILKSLPLDIKALMVVFNLSKMPMNRRVNDLEKARLLKRDRWKGKVEITELGRLFIKKVESLKKGFSKEYIKG